ncbi:hypothetical protein M434DRAFT_7450 [Hypoxylon sp. CO27-5]|nr:hypothetical protein M434DRAFT_7450 [Hypoxylon sp. CO27-5]
MAHSNGNKRKSDWEATVMSTPKKLKSSDLWSSLFRPTSLVDEQTPEGTKLPSVSQGFGVELPPTNKVLNAPIANMHGYQYQDVAEIHNSYEANKGRAAIYTTSTEIDKSNQHEVTVNESESARRVPTSGSSIYPAESKSEESTAVNTNGQEGMIQESDDAVLDLIKLCHGLRDGDAAAVLVAQINIGRKYHSVLEENEKLRGKLADREAHHRRVAGRVLELERLLSAQDAQLKEANTRLIAQKALEYMKLNCLVKRTNHESRSILDNFRLGT